MIRTLSKLIIVLIIIGLCLMVFFAVRGTLYQASLQPFYNVPEIPQNSRAGDLLRVQKMGIQLPDGIEGYRILYVSELADKTKVVSSGMVIIPKQKAPSQGRDILIWGHGTVGIASQCAPSRKNNPIGNLAWLGEATSKNWVVVATDYYGLGTPGVERFLIGQDQGRDLLNSARAVRQMQQAQAGKNIALLGLSQGGQTVLAAGNLAQTYTPELHLKGVVAAAPAAQLDEILERQYAGTIAWAIGPEMTATWPLTYPGLELRRALSKEGYENQSRISQYCIGQAVLEGMVRNFFGQQFFAENPLKIPTWGRALKEQTQQPLPSDIPVYIIQSLSDTVVPPSTTALYIERSCKADSSVTTLWLEGVEHADTSNVAASKIVHWLLERFTGSPPASSCGEKLPVTPANPLD